jgi:hypothetical protein
MPKAKLKKHQIQALTKTAIAIIDVNSQTAACKYTIMNSKTGHI